MKLGGYATIIGLTGVTGACVAMPIAALAEESLWRQVRINLVMRERPTLDAVEGANDAVRAAEREHGAEHLTVATPLETLGLLYQSQGRYVEAQHTFERQLRILEARFGAGHPRVATSRHRLGLLAHLQGRDEEAERLLRQALAMRQVELGPYDGEVAESLVDLGIFYDLQQRMDQAGPLLERGVAVRERHKSAAPLEYAKALNALASHAYLQQRYADAIPWTEHALAIDQRELGADSSEVAADLTNLGVLHEHTGDYEHAEQLYRQAMNIWESALAPDRPPASSFGMQSPPMQRVGSSGFAEGASRPSTPTSQQRP